LQTTYVAVTFAAPDFVTGEALDRARRALLDRAQLGPVANVPMVEGAAYSRGIVAQNVGDGVLVQMDVIRYSNMTLTFLFSPGGRAQVQWPWNPMEGGADAPYIPVSELRGMVQDAAGILNPDFWETAEPSSRGAGFLTTSPVVIGEEQADGPNRRIPFQLATPDVRTFTDAMTATMDAMMVGAPADIMAKAFPGRFRIVAGELLARPAVMVFFYLGEGEEAAADGEIVFPVQDPGVDAAVAGFFRDFTEKGELGPRMAEIVAEAARTIVEEPLSFRFHSRVKPEGESIPQTARLAMEAGQSVFLDNTFKVG
jgi:hypothetical protein